MKSIHSLCSPHAAACVFVLLAPLAIAGQTVQGVPNFQSVDEHVLRGGQPSEKGFKNLAARGVKTILDLRETDSRSQAEKRIVESLGMRYVNIPMKGMHTPSENQISGALKVLKDDSKTPVFVHCRRGADRTGAVVACYRIRRYSWDNAKALKEARGYGMSWYQFQLAHYVLAYNPPRDSQALASSEEATPLRP